jgi:hypothetical protein
MAGWLIITVIWHASCTALTAVQLAGDWVCHAAELLLLLLEIFCGSGGGVLLDPVLSLLDGFEKLQMC